MPNTVEQAVLLTEAGARALEHLKPWLNERFLRCREVEVHTQGYFLTVVAVPHALPFEEAAGDAKLWIPLHHIDLVVTDSSKSQIGFVRS